METEIELLLSLSDSAEELRISLTIKSCTCLIQEDNGFLDIIVLATDQDSDESIFDWVQLGRKSLHHMLIQLKQVGVLVSIEGLIFAVVNQFKADLMPHLLLVLQSDCLDQI